MKLSKLLLPLTLVGFIAIATVSALVLFEAEKAPSSTNSNPPTRYITSYSDGAFLYNCSRPIRATLQNIPGRPSKLLDESYVPSDPAEAKLFCYSTAAIENEGKVKILQRSEVLKMIRPYAYQDVSVKALEFGKVKGFTSDKVFAQWFAQYLERSDGRKREVGCIIVVETPGPKKVYLEDEKLEIFEEMDYAVFEHYLTRVNSADRRLFLDNLK
jgi:hypothetical protein